MAPSCDIFDLGSFQSAHLSPSTASLFIPIPVFHLAVSWLGKTVVIFLHFGQLDLRPSSLAMHVSLSLYVAFVLGVLSHNCLFIYGEWHMQAPTILKAYFVLSLAVLLMELKYGARSFLESLMASVYIIATYAIAIFTSITIYRKFFHRLRNFPGPWMAGITKFWHTYQCIGSQNHLLLDDMYQKYGPFVRTGPEEITVFHPEILPAVDGPGNSCTKAVWYDLLLPEIALNTTRSKPDHDRRRRIWDSGFSTKALANYEDRVVEYAELLESRIADLAAANQPVNVSLWFYWFTFDVMGEFAFAKPFGMLQHEEWHVAVVMLRKAMRLLGPLSPVPWLAQIGFNLVPWLWVVRDWLAMLVWCRERMSERIKVWFPFGRTRI